MKSEKSVKSIAKRKKFKVIGLMSGTSLDGLDIAHCTFTRNGDNWKYSINYAGVAAYPSELHKKLVGAMALSGFELSELDVQLGRFFADCVRQFCAEMECKTDLIASHGHTVFHCPSTGLTKQIGSGAVIAVRTGIDTVCDFRTVDVALGGQGAPLVPIGDELLFPQYDFCLNLGGFSNISFRENDHRIAYDIAPNNMALNYLANLLGHEYDKNGDIARSGNIDETLFNRLQNLEYYRKQPPKSLGKEWFDENFKPVLDECQIPIADKLATVTAHIAHQLAGNFTHSGRVLITGGGAYNKFLIESLSKLTDNELVVPDKLTIEYKEALIFAFLGLLRVLELPNCLKTVTGASFDSVCGCVYKGLVL